MVTGEQQASPRLYREGRRRRRHACCCDGRTLAAEGGGYFLGPTIFDNVTPDMTIAREEIFGPVLSVIRVNTLEDAIALVNRSRVRQHDLDLHAEWQGRARILRARVEVGMVGVNIGVAAPMAFFPFAGWKNSFFGDLHAHGKDAVLLLHRTEGDDDPLVLMLR